MKAALINEVGRGFDIEDIEISAPVGREVLVDVRASGLCHSDHIVATKGMGFPTPSVWGHEVAGVVAAIGPQVSQFQTGQHVVACLVQACGMCSDCLSGRPYQCPNAAATLRPESAPPRISRNGEGLYQGFGLGGFDERMLVHENQLAAVPDELPFAQAALIDCGVLTGAGSVLNTADVRTGDTVVVIGAGGVGLSGISGARIAGASRIIAVDVQAGKLVKAEQFGATDIVDSSTVDPVAAVLDLVPGGVDHVFDFVGIAPVAEQGLAMLAIGGGLYIVGISGPEANVSINMLDAVQRQTRVQGIYIGSSSPKHDIPMYADLYLGGQIDLDHLVSKEIALDELNDGYAALEDPAISRVVITSF